MIGYKLTDENDRTWGDTQWGEGVTHTADGWGRLCTSSWIHLYDDPLVAVFLDPIHGGFVRFDRKAHLWEVEWSGDTLDKFGLKRGATTVTTVRRLELPVVNIIQRIAFGILCASKVTHNPDWHFWAKRWLSGEERGAFPASVISYNLNIAYAATLAAKAAAFPSNAAACAASAASYAAQGALLDIPTLTRQAMTYNTIEATP